MNSITFVVQQIPTFDQLKQPPRTALEGVWLIGICVFIFTLWGLKKYLDQQLSLLKERYESQIEEEKSERRQREAMIKHLMSQNEVLLKERGEMIASMARLSRIIGAAKIGESTLGLQDEGKKN